MFIIFVLFSMWLAVCNPIHIHSKYTCNLFIILTEINELEISRCITADLKILHRFKFNTHTHNHYLCVGICVHIFDCISGWLVRLGVYLHKIPSGVFTCRFGHLYASINTQFLNTGTRLVPTRCVGIFIHSYLHTIYNLNIQ